MLTRIYVNNYKCLVNFEIDLKPIQLILGDNGSGKSAMREVLWSIRSMLMDGVAVQRAFPSRTLTRWQTLNDQRFEIDVEHGGIQYRYVLQLEHAREQKLARIIREELTGDGKPLFDFHEGHVQLYGDNHSKGPDFNADWERSALSNVGEAKNNKQLIKFKQWMSRLSCLKPDPYRMTAQSEEESRFLDERLENFVSWYRLASDENPEGNQALARDLEQVIEGFSSLPMISFAESARQLNMRQRIGGVDRPILCSFDEISDGQRILVALYSLLRLGLHDGATLCLDEPDNFIALREVRPFLMSLADRIDEEPGTQAIIISHNAAIIDYLAPNCGLVVYRQDSGPSRVRPFKLPDGLVLSASEAVARGWDNE
ncbi:MAG: AAA family ATPase [Capsulimonadaceae bacterium]